MLWTQVGDLFRFPLAGVPPTDKTREFYFPLSMPPMPENFLGAIRLNGTALERDGLAEFNEELFMDPDLIKTQTMDLAGEAEYLMYLVAGAATAHRNSRRVSVRRGDDHFSSRRGPSWMVQGAGRSAARTAAFVSTSAVGMVALSRLRSTNPGKARAQRLRAATTSLPVKAVHEPEWGNFLDCSIKVIEPPELLASTTLSNDGTFTLSWSSSPPIEGSFILEESGAEDFINVAAIYSGTATSFTLYGRKSGDFFYRVRAVCWRTIERLVERRRSARGRSRSLARRRHETDFAADKLFARRAARGAAITFADVRGARRSVVLASLPEHYREGDAIAHAGVLKATPEVARSIERRTAS